MTVEDAVQMMGVLESLHDGTPRSAERIKRLNWVLLKEPSQFWDDFWDAVNADDPIRKHAEEQLRQLGPDATFADMQRIQQQAGDAK
jgi:hypothetical protein